MSSGLQGRTIGETMTTVRILSVTAMMVLTLMVAACTSSTARSGAPRTSTTTQTITTTTTQATTTTTAARWCEYWPDGAGTDWPAYVLSRSQASCERLRDGTVTSVAPTPNEIGLEATCEEAGYAWDEQVAIGWDNSPGNVPAGCYWAVDDFPDVTPTPQPPTIVSPTVPSPPPPTTEPYLTCAEWLEAGAPAGLEPAACYG